MLPFDPKAAIEIVREAAQMALDLQGRVRVDIKPDNTFVTEADRQLEAFLREKLGALAPEYSFLGEEMGLTGDPNAPAWVIDPIDGTNNFVRNVPLWCVSVGLIIDGRSVFGIVAVPPQNELYWALDGEGAWLESDGQSTRLQVEDRTSFMHEDLIAFNTEVERVVDFAGVGGSQRNFGTVAYHMVSLARGSMVAALACKHQLYDVAGGMCICVEAGCTARYLDGREWVADLTEGKALVPLLIAPPQTGQRLGKTLVVRTATG